MAGLPGSGKSTVAAALGRALAAPVLSVDPIESAMWRAGVGSDQPTGYAAYVVADAIARETLALGLTVVIDAVNAVEAARGQWRRLAADTPVPLRFIEVACSDENLHRARIESRVRELAGHERTSWDTVIARRAEWEPWNDERLVLDSAGDAAPNTERALRYVAS